MSDDRELMETVKFGIEVEAFLEGKIGRYLVERARREVAEAQEALATVVPSDTQEIIRLQNQVFRAKSFESWLAEAVAEGWNAEAQLRSQEAGL